MKLKVFTLRYDEQIGGFDDGDLQSFLKERDAVSVHEHFFVDGSRPHWALLVSYRDVPRPAERDRSERGRTDWRAELGPADRDLYDALRRWRATRAKRDGRPPYVLLTNRQMAAIARDRPTTAAALMEVEGIGEGRAREYGEAMLAVVAQVGQDAAAASAPSVEGAPAGG